MIVTVDSIHKRFGGNYLNKNTINLENKIKKSSISRLGMELNDVFLEENIETTIIWGKRESLFLSSLSEEKKFYILKKIFSKNPPLFLLSKFFQEEKLLMEINKKFKNSAAIIKLNYSTSEIFTLIVTWLSKSFANWETIHGTVMSIFGEGVLIIGEPGIGKSEISLELLKKNHLFLGDDAVQITRIGNALISKSHNISNKFIQIRGLGILNLKEMYGSSKIIEETKISVIIELMNSTDYKDLNLNFDNLGHKINYKKILNIKIPIYKLPVIKGRDMGEIIESAVIDIKMKRQGYNSAKKFNELAKKIINEN